jgi:hypothetical protein
MPPSLTTGTEGLAPHCAHTGAAQTRATRLPEATRAAQMRRWGLHPERTGDTPRRAEDPEGDFLASPGWTIAYPGGEHDGGTVAHRGVLHPAEYVDQDALSARVAEALGFAAAQIRAVYRQGPLSPEGRALRARIDARILEVATKGGLMVELGRALGLTVQPDGHCRAINNALARARKEQS